MTRFSDLREGDFFEAYGGLFQKIPRAMVDELSHVNAVNMTTRRLAFFGPTVPVEFIDRVHLDIDDPGTGDDWESTGY